MKESTSPFCVVCYLVGSKPNKFLNVREIMEGEGKNRTAKAAKAQTQSALLDHHTILFLNLKLLKVQEVS